MDCAVITDLTPEALDQLEATAKAAYEVIPYRESTHWHWSGDTSGGYPRLALSAWVHGHGRRTLMDFTRWGMQSAGPRFPDAAMMMQDARTRVTFEVGRRGVVGQKAAELDPSVYRYDVTGVSHPVAEHIVAADPATVLALIAEVRKLRKLRTKIARVWEAAERIDERSAAVIFHSLKGGAL